MKSKREDLIRLMRALNRIEGQYVRMRRALGLRESLFVLLYACADGIPRSQREICEEWHMPPTTLNTIVREQVAAGNVELRPRGDGQKDVLLTKSGLRLASELLGPLLDAEEQVSSSCIDEDLVLSLEALANMVESAFGADGD